MKKNAQYFYMFSYLYVLTIREAVLCYLGSMCLPWMTEIMWFLSILILTRAQFHKGQEWRSEKVSRECFITRLENMGSSTSFIVLGCRGKVAYQKLRPGVAWRAKWEACVWCLHLSHCCGHPKTIEHILLSNGKKPFAWRTFLCLLELFVDHTLACQSSGFLSVYINICVLSFIKLL